MLEDNQPQINFDSISSVEPKRRLQLLFALALLLVALALVVLKNREFWSDALGLQETSEQTTAAMNTKVEPHVGRSRSRKAGAKQILTSDAGRDSVIPTELQETKLSPLQVDVTYSSGQHKTLVARNSAVHVDMQQSSQSFLITPASAAPPSTGVEANERSSGAKVRFTDQSMEILGHPAEPVYPLQAQQEKVQGSVLLLAQIGEDGNVKSLNVVSGPAILTAAALEAVKQWHFKPHYQDGHPVPAETRIMVNFTISTQ
ncbi:MAG: energy transducer TonB [Terriglobales bacterium]